MSYIDPRQPTREVPLQRQPAPAYPVDEDGDRLYAEEDYGMPADGEAFLPDAQEEPELYADPFAAQSPYAYTGRYDTMNYSDEDWQDERENDYFDDDDLTDEERAELRRSNWKLLAGLADFGAIILGTAVILVLVALLVSLMNWLINDVSQTFTLLQMPF